jgi:hypothetical protein
VSCERPGDIDNVEIRRVTRAATASRNEGTEFVVQHGAALACCGARERVVRLYYLAASRPGCRRRDQASRAVPVSNPLARDTLTPTRRCDVHRSVVVVIRLVEVVCEDVASHPLADHRAVHDR